MLDLGKGAFGDEVADLEIVVAVDEDDEPAVVEVAECVFRVGGLACDAEPEDVYGDTLVNKREMSGDTRDGVAAIAADGECGSDLDGAVRSVGQDTGGGAVVCLNEAGGFPAHAEREGGKTGCFGGKEVEEVPLGHECDEFGVGGEVAEV